MFNFRPSTDNDLKAVIDIYNSNTSFLKSHLDMTSINIKWLQREKQSMQSSGFESIVISNDMDEIIGFIDYKQGPELYLSLLMIHDKHQNSGFGKEIYDAFEKLYCHECQSIRLDLVLDYDKKVEGFWGSRGYEFVEPLKLEWNGHKLDAQKMKKYL